MLRRPILCSLALLLGLLAAPAADAFERTSVLGSDGTLYTLRLGAFPELTGHDGRALVLEVHRSGDDVSRQLVPVEGELSPLGAPSLFIDVATETVSIVGEFRSGSPHSRLNLVTLQDGAWSEVIEISGSAFSLKGSPKLAVTHDRFTTAASDGAEARVYDRKVLHTIWWEETGTGIEVFYTPLIVLNGEYIGWNPVYALVDLLPAAPEYTAPMAESLLRNPTIASGRDSSSVALAAGDAASGRLWSFEMHVVDGHWSLLAAAGEAFLLESGQPRDEEALGTLADKARSHIIDIGNQLQLHPGKVAFAAASLADEIVAIGGAEPIGSLAERARSHIIDIGASFAPRPESHLAEKARSHIIDIGHRPPADGGPGDAGPIHALTLSRVASWPAPAIEGAAVPILIASEKGDRLLVGWDTPTSVRYRETRDGGGWSPVLELRLSDELTREAAYNILRQRIRNR